MAISQSIVAHMLFAGLLFSSFVVFMIVIMLVLPTIVYFLVLLILLKVSFSILPDNCIFIQ